MSYQNINQYNFRNFGLIPVNEITDICLASDEKDYDQEVIFSPLLIGEEDGNRMPFKFDLNSTGTTICQSSCDFDSDTIVSENYWNPTKIDVNLCPKITELCDIGLTGIDNGLVSQMSGETIELNTGLYTNQTDKFNRYKYDRRMKLHPITGFTTSDNEILQDNSYNYNMSFTTDGDAVGYFARLDGGFYQGFYKVAGYDYEIFPERPNIGWSTEIMLRYRWTGNTSVGLNLRYPENKGTFFYMGARAENKFYHYADGHPSQDTGYTRVTSGLTCIHTCGCASSANTASTCYEVYQISGGTSSTCNCGCPCSCSVFAQYPEKDPLYDGVSNAFSLRLSGDTASPRLCVKTYRITGGCETTGTCLTGLTYTTGTSVTEWCSARGIIDECLSTDYLDSEHWVQIDSVFERNEWFNGCDLRDKGGLGLIVDTVYTATSANNSISLIEPPITHEDKYIPETVEVVNFTDAWLREKDYRLGKLKLYVNGKLFMVVENFEEIIPRLLNVEKEKQIGVSYNISLGGGTQGLHDNLTFSGCPDSLSGMTYQQDPECLPTIVLDQTQYSGLTTDIFLEEYFGGSMIGDISAFRMYTEPLNASQVRHNFKILKNKYNLLNPDCVTCIKPTPSVTPTQTLTPTPSITPSITPTITLSPSITPTITLTPSITPTISVTPTLGLSPTPTPTITPTITPTPSSAPFMAYLFIEPYSGSSLIGQWMYDQGSNFFGFTNNSQPSRVPSEFTVDMNTYVGYSGWTSGLFPGILSSSVPQTSGGVDSFGNAIEAYNFETLEVIPNTVGSQAWFTFIIPVLATNNQKQISIGYSTSNANSLLAARTEPTIYNNSFLYTGTTIPNYTYSVYTTYPGTNFRLTNGTTIYFKGNSIS